MTTFSCSIVEDFFRERERRKKHGNSTCQRQQRPHFSEKGSLRKGFKTSTKVLVGTFETSKISKHFTCPQHGIFSENFL